MAVSNFHGWPRTPQWLHKFNYTINRNFVRNYAVTLGIWGTFGVTTLLYLLEPTPIARRDIFANLPVVGGYWASKLPVEHKESEDDE